MKKIFLIFLIFLMVIFIYASEKKELSDFLTEADNVSLKLAKITEELNNKRIKYERKIEEIENLKNKRYKFFILDFFNNLYLKYQLGIANDMAYKIYNITKKQRELNNDYFTIVSLIMTEYGEKIRNCIKNRCSELKDLYKGRAKWLDIIINYENYIGVDLAYDIFEKKYDEKSRKDLQEYLEKKIIQIEQRIYLLNEEKITEDMLKNSNVIFVKDEQVKFDKKINDLQKLKYIIQEKFKELEKQGE